MTNTKKTKRISKKLCHVLLMVVLMFGFTTITAFADTTSELDAANVNGILVTMFNFIKAISVPMACIGIAMCAFSFFMPNEKSWDIAKKRLFHIGAALAIIMLVPAIFKFSEGTWRSMAWNPNGGNTQIINGVGTNPNLTNGPQPESP